MLKQQRIQDRCKTIDLIHKIVCKLDDNPDALKGLHLTNTERYLLKKLIDTTYNVHLELNEELEKKIEENDEIFSKLEW